MKNWLRFPTLVLSAMLHLAPLMRVAVAESVVASSPVLAVLRWLTGVAAVAGAVHGVSGATGLTITQGGATVSSVTATNGVQVVGFRMSIVSSIQGTAASYTFKNLPQGLAGSLQGVVSGVPTLSGQFTVTVTGWANAGGKGDNYSTTFPVSVMNGSLPAAQTISFGPIADQTYGGAPLSLSASASSGLPVSFSVVSGPATLIGNSLSFTGAGTVLVSASQAGNASFSAAPSVTQSITVLKAAQTISFGAFDPAGYPIGKILSLSAISSAGLPITFAVVSGSATLIGNELSLIGSGTVVVSATQSGNQLYSAATPVQQTISVQGTSLQSQTISFGALQSTSYSVGLTVPLIATASSGLPVSFSVVSGPGVIGGNGLTVTGAGTITVAASQPGNTAFSAATPVSSTLTIAKAVQTISFVPIATISLGSAPVPLTATSASSLPVTFAILSGPATVVGSQLTISGIGTLVVAADQPGDGNYLPASQIVQNISVVPGLVFQPASGSVGPSLHLFLDTGVNAQVEEATDLNSWTPLSTISGQGPNSAVNFALSISPDAVISRFWRLRVLP